MRSPRLELVRQLAMAERDPNEVLAELARYRWDSDEQLRVSATPISAILQRYLRGELSVDFVVDWANAIELREDVGFDESIATAVRSVIHELANPDLEGALTENRAAGLMPELAQAPFSSVNFSGYVSRRLVETTAGAMEVFFMSFPCEPNDLASDEIVIDEFEFKSQPKLGPAVVYRRTLAAHSDVATYFEGNNYESLVGAERDLEGTLTHRVRYDDEFIELSWGFNDYFWDALPQGKWFAARCVRRDHEALEEVLVLHHAKNAREVREQVEAVLTDSGAQLVTPIEVEDTYLVRPGLGTPPLFYIAKRPGLNGGRN